MTGNLLRLGQLLGARIETFHQVRAAENWNDERVADELEKFSDLENRILAIPARNLDELAVKAKTVLWLQGCSSVDEMCSNTGNMSLVKDILNMRASIK